LRFAAGDARFAALVAPAARSLCFMPGRLPLMPRVVRQVGPAVGRRDLLGFDAGDPFAWPGLALALVDQPECASLAVAPS